MHVMSREEGEVRDLPYGLFESPEDSILESQQRSTALLLGRLPPPPRRVLDVGMGLGRTLAELARAGYDAEGITPDQQQRGEAGGMFSRLRPVRFIAWVQSSCQARELQPAFPAI